MKRVGVLSVLFFFMFSTGAFAMGFLGGGSGSGGSLNQSVSAVDSIKIKEFVTVKEIDESWYSNLEFLINNKSSSYLWAFAVGLPTDWEDIEGIIVYPNPGSGGEWKGFEYWKSMIVPVNNGEEDLRDYLENYILGMSLSDVQWDSILRVFDDYPYAYLAYFAVDEVNGNYFDYLISPGDNLETDLFGILYPYQGDYGSPFLVVTSNGMPGAGQAPTFSLGFGETTKSPNSGRQGNALAPEPNSLVLMLIGIGLIPIKRRF